LSKGSEGITLTCAHTMIYYNVSHKLLHRRQSEDRAHRPGQTSPVTIIDIVANDTVDERIIEALRNKREVASQVTGEELKTWI